MFPRLPTNSPYFAGTAPARVSRRKIIKACVFGLLLAAWICANNPQAALVSAISWLQESHRQTGHDNLRSAVAQLLASSKKAPEQSAECRDNKRPDQAPASTGFTLRKLELAVESVVCVPGGARNRIKFNLPRHSLRKLEPILPCWSHLAGRGDKDRAFRGAITACRRVFAGLGAHFRHAFSVGIQPYP